ncbi:hypothetical protein SHKM778_13980 [Streptomyces sp. KM77-8]|uniref:Uncharacterized protein n=1 Tax=Streptomyces haneummycinicus TaxID=3074435 RepID=A0AAT9HCA2_9ACTN
MGVLGAGDGAQVVQQGEVVLVAGVQGLQVEVDALVAGVEHLTGGADDGGAGGGVLQTQAVGPPLARTSPRKAWTRTPGSSRCTASISQRARGYLDSGRVPSCSSGPEWTYRSRIPVPSSRRASAVTSASFFRPSTHACPSHMASRSRLYAVSAGSPM